MRLYLIRHGETEWSASGQHTSRTDLPLTAHGQEEARDIAATVAGVNFTHIISSPRLRARQTCAHIDPDGRMQIDEELTEWDYGEYEGRRSVDILQDRPGWNLFRDGAPGGETPQQVTDRVDRVCARLRALSGDVAVCSHGHLGRVLGVRWIGLPIAAAQRLLLGTATVSILDSAYNRADFPVIALWNATALPK
jgi:probable phosphoglycerate mutase